MGPLLLVGLVGGAATALYFLTKGNDGGGAQTLDTTGKSGSRWRVTPAKAHEAGAEFYFMNVWSINDQFGIQGAFPVLQYRQTGTDKTSRLFVLRFPNVPDTAFQTAVSDFGVTVRGG